MGLLEQGGADGEGWVRRRRPAGGGGRQGGDTRHRGAVCRHRDGGERPLHQRRGSGLAEAAREATRGAGELPAAIETGERVAEEKAETLQLEQEVAHERIEELTLESRSFKVDNSSLTGESELQNRGSDPHHPGSESWLYLDFWCGRRFILAFLVWMRIYTCFSGVDEEAAASTNQRPAILEEGGGWTEQDNWFSRGLIRGAAWQLREHSI